MSANASKTITLTLKLFNRGSNPFTRREKNLVVRDEVATQVVAFISSNQKQAEECSSIH